MSEDGRLDEGWFEHDYPGLAASERERHADASNPGRPSLAARLGVGAAVLAAGLVAGGATYLLGAYLVGLDRGSPYPKRGAVESLTAGVDAALAGRDSVDVAEVERAVEDGSRRFAVREVTARRELDGREVRVLAQVPGDGADPVCVQVVARIGVPAREIGSWTRYRKECGPLPEGDRGEVTSGIVERRKVDGQAALAEVLGRYAGAKPPHDVVALRAVLPDVGPLLTRVSYELRGGEVGVSAFVSGSYHCVIGWRGPEGSVQTWVDYFDREGKCQAGGAFSAVPSATGR